MSEGFIDLDPDAVASAGNSTAGTAGDWTGWASTAEGQLRSAAGGARDPVVSAAFEGYASTWNPALHGLATLVTALGRNATSAAGVMSGADSDSAALLNAQGGSAEALGSHLRRPITG